jgi:o-succinylbenzoate synthase
VIPHLEVRAYRLPLRRTWQSARGTLGSRAGWLVCARGGGLAGYGDCAPLPAAGTETPERALAALSHWRQAAEGKPLEAALRLVSGDRTPCPAARFAVESALLDLAARREGLPLRHWLSPRPRDTVAVNGTLGTLGDLTPRMLRDGIAAGFRVLKVKVGLREPGEELQRLAELAPHLPAGAGFRLDANGAWTRADAVRMIDGLNALPVESLEEPLREPEATHLRRLQSMARFPLALDESLHRPGHGIELGAIPVRRIVLKPAVLGSVGLTLQMAEEAAGLGIQVVLTSLIESAAGIWTSLQLAAAVPSTLAHGLATSDWLKRDLGPAPAVVEGRIRLPREAGSGFQPDDRCEATD